MQPRDSYHAHRARLAQAGEHWQKQLAYGSEHVGWSGDRALVMYHEPILDNIEIWHELPGRKATIVMRVPSAEFEINKALATLRDADNRRTSMDEKIAASDAHNQGILDAQAAKAAEMNEEVKEKMRWAIRKDTGQHIAPIVIPTRSGRAGLGAV